jgi:hypothetical protein
MEIPKLPRILKWLVLLGIYFVVLNFCASSALLPLTLSGLFSRQDTLASLISGLASFLVCIIPFVVIGGLMAVVVLAYRKDKSREQLSSDDFKNDNLLYRYGYKINQTTLSIPVKTEWTDEEIYKFSVSMRQKISTQIQSRFESFGVEVVNPVTIKDKNMQQDSRDFLKIIFRSRRGSQVSHFIYYAVAGKYVVIHYLTYVRGKYWWHDIVDFVITGPLHIWFWGVDWLQNQYSIITAISKHVNNSYDLLDLETFFEASYFVLLDETRNFLKEEGLLSEELNQIIVNNINNSQNITVSHSKGLSFENIANTAKSVLPTVK